MATLVIPVISGSNNADTNATVNSVVLRDNQAGIFGAVVQGSTLETTGNFIGSVSNQTATFTAGAFTDYLLDSTGGNISVVFPLASANAGVVYYFLKTVSANTVTFTGVSGTGSISSQWAKVRVFSDGVNWYSA